MKFRPCCQYANSPGLTSVYSLHRVKPPFRRLPSESNIPKRANANEGSAGVYPTSFILQLLTVKRNHSYGFFSLFTTIRPSFTRKVPVKEFVPESVHTPEPFLHKEMRPAPISEMQETTLSSPHPSRVSCTSFCETDNMPPNRNALGVPSGPEDEFLTVAFPRSSAGLSLHRTLFAPTSSNTGAASGLSGEPNANLQPYGCGFASIPQVPAA